MKSKLLFSSALVALGLVGLDAHAVGARRFVLNTLDSFKGGDLAGVALGSDGTVRAGFTLGKQPLPDHGGVWDVLVLQDGSVLLGTGKGGHVRRVRGGQSTVVAKTGGMAVASLAIGDGAVFAGTFPDGAIYKLDPKAEAAKDAAPEKPWVTLPETENVWDLAYDASSKALYAATGPEGRLYRIDASGKAEVFFDSDEPHLVSVAVGADGSVFTGSSGKALLYKVTAPGRASVLHDFDGDDVRAIAIVPSDAPHGGEMYVTANDYRGQVKGLRPQKRAKLQPNGEDSAEPKAGKGKLVRFATSGAMETMLEDSDTHFIGLAIDARGLPYVGTGNEGRVITVDDRHVVQVVADTEERQVVGLAVSGPTRFVMSSDPVVFHEITGSGGAAAVWTSRVLDAGARATFGRVEWTVDGALELQTRSGNTDKPDGTWSDWSPALLQAGDIASPPGRFFQVRARFAKDPNAVLHEVRVSFKNDNVRAILTSADAGDVKAELGGSTIPASGAAPSDANPKLKLRWQLDNPDNDELRFRLFFRPLGMTRWTSLLDAGEVLTKREYFWDTSGLPEGRYRFRVDASDEISNAPGAALQHSLESQTFTIDNTAPVLSNLALKGNRLTLTASDGIGPIARVEIALVGERSFYPLAPSDGILDEATEAFDADIAGLVPEGPQHIVVRAYDAAGNRTSATVTR
jgi:hypothetical protein